MLLVLAAACTAPNVSPGRPSPKISPARSVAATAFPSELAAGAGWNVIVQAIEETPGRAGYDNLEATLLLHWAGPGLGTAPSLGASVTSTDGSVLGMQATVFGDSPVLAPVGYAVPAEIIGEWPTSLPGPQLHIFSTGDAPFHEAFVRLDEPLAPSSPPPLPSVGPNPVLEVAGQLRITPSLLTVAHWSGDETTVFVRHGARSIEYGDAGDFWQISAGVTVENLGSAAYPLSQLSFELFDDSWAESSPDVLADPRQDADSLPAAGTISFALSFQTDDRPSGLRLVTVVSDAGGAAVASGVAGFDAAAVTTGTKTFADLLGALDRFQGTCSTAVSDGSSVAATIGTATVEFAGASDPRGALIRTTDNYRGARGERLGSAENTYVLARNSGPWQVEFTTANPSGQPRQC
jgi:hypothetical protein